MTDDWRLDLPSTPRRYAQWQASPLRQFQETIAAHRRDGRTLRSIAEAAGLTTERVRQICLKVELMRAYRDRLSAQ
jgi:hypothetical protein